MFVNGRRPRPRFFRQKAMHKLGVLDSVTEATAVDLIDALHGKTEMLELTEQNNSQPPDKMRQQSQQHQQTLIFGRRRRLNCEHTKRCTCRTGQNAINERGRHPRQTSDQQNKRRTSSTIFSFPSSPLFHHPFSFPFPPPHHDGRCRSDRLGILKASRCAVYHVVFSGLLSGSPATPLTRDSVWPGWILDIEVQIERI